MSCSKRSRDGRDVLLTQARPRLGDFPIGSALSRAAARILLKDKRHAANREADVRIVFDLTGGLCPGHVARSIDPKGKITDIIFPAHVIGEECHGVFAVPPGVDLEVALRQARSRQKALTSSQAAPIDVSRFLKAGLKAQWPPIDLDAVQRYPKVLAN